MFRIARRPALRFFLVTVWVATASLAAGVPTARAQSGADASAIQRVITSQIEAFLDDRGADAFSHASPGIQGMFGTAERFMAMVRGGYPAVYRPRSFTFEGLSDQDGQTVQRVYFVGPDGRPVIARYFMQRQPDGGWRINGVTVEPAPDLTT